MVVTVAKSARAFEARHHNTLCARNKGNVSVDICTIHSIVNGKKSRTVSIRARVNIYIQDRMIMEAREKHMECKDPG